MRNVCLESLSPPTAVWDALPQTAVLLAADGRLPLREARTAIPHELPIFTARTPVGALNEEIQTVP